MREQDIERILRDVLDAQGLRVSVVRIERTSDGWRVEVRDAADRLLIADLPGGPPAAVRAVLTRWALNHD